jgi:hypothetical protein
VFQQCTDQFKSVKQSNFYIGYIYNKKGSVSICPALKQTQWNPPEGDMLKVNCDGAFAASSGTGGWGFVLRDHDGAVRGSGAGYLATAASAALAEAHACQEAVHAAAGWGVGHLHVESDALRLVKAGQLSRSYARRSNLQGPACLCTLELYFCSVYSLPKGV